MERDGEVGKRHGEKGSQGDRKDKRNNKKID
jgi:hypothetical protein